MALPTSPLPRRPALLQLMHLVVAAPKVVVGFGFKESGWVWRGAEATILPRLTRERWPLYRAAPRLGGPAEAPPIMAVIWKRLPDGTIAEVENKFAGLTFKTKPEYVDEMSVAKGFGCFDSPLLTD